MAPEGGKVGSLKRRVRRQLARWEMRKCTPLWREAHFQVKMYKTHQVRTTFARCDVEKVHAVVARSTFPSENVQNTTCSDHFWRLRCRLSKKCTPLWREDARSTFRSQNVQSTPCSVHFWRLRCRLSKKCTPLWREAHVQVKMHKTHQCWTTFGSCDVEKVRAVVARSTFPSENVQNTTCSDHFWRLRCRLSKKCTPLWREAHFQVKMYKAHHVRSTFGGSDVDFRKSARRCGAKHISKSKCTKHTMFGPLLEAQMSTFEKVHAVVARSTFPSQNVQNTPCSVHFWRLRCRLSKKCTPLWREAYFQVKMLKTLAFPTTFGGSAVASLRFTPKIYTTLHDTTLHYTSSGCGRDLLSR